MDCDYTIIQVYYGRGRQPWIYGENFQNKILNYSNNITLVVYSDCGCYSLLHLHVCDNKESILMVCNSENWPLYYYNNSSLCIIVCHRNLIGIWILLLNTMIYQKSVGPNNLQHTIQVQCQCLSFLTRLSWLWNNYYLLLSIFLSFNEYTLV